jgi:hypothetical protein
MFWVFFGFWACLVFGLRFVLLLVFSLFGWFYSFSFALSFPSFCFASYLWLKGNLGFTR